MADSQSGVSSSVAPGDSVSSRGGRKGKPGKAERAAKRATQGGTPGQPASGSKASAFAAGSFGDPVPQPGMYPVVFQTGAGEPSRECSFAYAPDVMSDVVTGFANRYTKNARYAEFKAHSGLTDGQFSSYTAVAALLGLAQQTVFSHVNMGLPQGDFGPVASSEVLNFSAIRAYLSQFGEFSVPSLGTRFVLNDYESTVSRLIYAAEKIMNSGGSAAVIQRSWLPMSPHDGVTRLIIAEKLHRYLEGINVRVSGSVLEDAVLSGTVPDIWAVLKTQFGDPPSGSGFDRRDRFDFLFKAYADVGVFTNAFTTVRAAVVLGELDLPWDAPSAGHLDWGFNPKVSFSSLADRWSRVAITYGSFFSMGSGAASRAVARGTEAQMVDVSETSGVTVVKTHLALSAQQFSLSACFPPECIFVGSLERKVVVTTPLAVTQLATLFCLRDWK